MEYDLININIMLGIYILSLFNFKNIHKFDLYIIFTIFSLTSFYFIYNSSYVITIFILLLTIFKMPNYTILFDFNLILMIIINLYNYNKLFDIYNIGLIFGIQYCLLYFTNIIFKHYIKNKYPMIEIYTNSIIGSNIIAWGLFTLTLLFINSSISIKNILGYFIIFCQYIFNPNNPDKQLRSIPNQVITLLIEIYSKFNEQLINYKKEQEINYKLYTVVGNFIKNTNEKINKPKYKLELGDIIELNNNDITPATLLLLNKKTYISTIQIDGEKNLKLKININQYNLNINNYLKNTLYDYIYNDNIHVIRKNSIIKGDNINGIIINTNHSKIEIPKIFELDKIIKNIELLFVLITIVLFCINFIFGSLVNEINIYNIINYFIGIQMINPMSISCILFIILSKINIKYFNYNGKKQIVASFKNNKIIHCSDKTGTLTCNKFNYHFSLFNPLVDSSKLNEYIIRCSSNSINNPNIIPEEEEYFNKLNLKYTSYEKKDFYIIKNNIYKQLFIGFVDHFKASFNLNILNDKVFLLIQSGEDFAIRMDNSAPDLNKIYEYSYNSNINIKDGAPRIWYILESNIINMDETTLNYVCNKYYEIKNDKKKLIIYITKLLKIFKINYFSVQIMTDKYKDYVREMILYNKINNIPFFIITGDNYNASKRISDDLFNKNPVIFLNREQQINFIKGSLDIDFNNNNIICYSSESNIKGDIILKLKQYKQYRIIYSGDGKNDIQALNNADISIGFKDNYNNIDHEISLVCGLIVDNNFWNYYITHFYKDGFIIKNILFKSIHLLILKQSSITGLMLGYFIKYIYTNFNFNLNSNFIWIENFNSLSYFIFQLISFIIILSSIYLKNFYYNYNISFKHIIKLTFFNVFFNIILTFLNLSYNFYFIINIFIMIIYLLK